jgi:hypothetical protein
MSFIKTNKLFKTLDHQVEMAHHRLRSAPLSGASAPRAASAGRACAWRGQINKSSIKVAAWHAYRSLCRHLRLVEAINELSFVLHQQKFNIDLVLKHCLGALA